MDTAFFLGIGAALAGVVIFAGSVWMLMAVVMGGRLAYFVTASVTLGFLLIMGVVWTINPLGPVGELPSFSPQAIGEGTDVNFGPASSFPEDPWVAPATDDAAAQEERSTLESEATDYLATAIEDGEIDTFNQPDQAAIVADSARFVEQDGTKYGAVLMQSIDTAADAETVDPTLPESVLVVMKFNPGNVLGMARMITVGTLILLLAHLFGLSRAERKAGLMRARTA